MTTRSLMFQGTGSDVGKSLIVAGLCRLFARRGLRVVPFKAQNMSNNAAVTSDDSEIGRAQWLQAVAAGVEPSVHMNPVLLKPQSDRMSQIIVRGKVAATMKAQEYQAWRETLLPTIMESYRFLAGNADLVLVEGAGSPAEINLRQHDIANMGFARAANCPVVLIGDIDRGGVIASLVGTSAILAAEDRKIITAFIINKFRGDAALFAQGVTEITQRTSWPFLGLVPYHPNLMQLPQEDSLALNNNGEKFPLLPSLRAAPCAVSTHLVALTYPHIANFDDLDALQNEPEVQLTWLHAGEVIPADADLVILPGSKATIADLDFVRAQGWDIDLHAHRRRGGRIMGICGGYQMLGMTLSDPHGVEGAPSTVKGLELLSISTVFLREKTVTPWVGMHPNSGCAINGYEIHAGVSDGPACMHPFFQSDNGPEGACSEDGLVWGSYIHGAFANDDFRKHLLAQLGAPPSTYTHHQHMQRILDEWADVLEQALDIEHLLSMARPVL